MADPAVCYLIRNRIESNCFRDRTKPGILNCVTSKLRLEELGVRSVSQTQRAHLTISDDGKFLKAAERGVEQLLGFTQVHVRAIAKSYPALNTLTRV